MSALPDPGCTPSPDLGHCLTCGDVAEPMRVVRVDEARGLALCVDAAGVRRSVEVELVAGTTPGDVLLVHAGTAIARDAPIAVAGAPREPAAAGAPHPEPAA